MFSSYHQFIYLHVPKTGGNSIQNTLLPFSNDQKTTQSGYDGQHRFGIEGDITPFKHAKLSDYAKRLGNKLPEFHILISVRHPFDRLVSFYFSPHRWGGYGPQDGVISPVFEEEKFIKLAQNLEPMTHFLKLDNKISRPDTTLRFENLKLEFSEFISKVNIPIAASNLPHINKSSGSSDIVRHIRGSRRLRNATEGFLMQDLEYFDYDLFS